MLTRTTMAARSVSGEAGVVVCVWAVWVGCGEGEHSSGIGVRFVDLLVGSSALWGIVCCMLYVVGVLGDGGFLVGGYIR